MSDLRIYIPKAHAFQRVAKSAIAAATQIDHGTEMNDAHAFALLEFFEFLAPEQITPQMGPGLAAEFSAIIENEFTWDSLGDRTPVQNILCTHGSDRDLAWSKRRRSQCAACPSGAASIST